MKEDKNEGKDKLLMTGYSIEIALQNYNALKIVFLKARGIKFDAGKLFV